MNKYSITKTNTGFCFYFFAVNDFDAGIIASRNFVVPEGKDFHDIWTISMVEE